MFKKTLLIILLIIGSLSFYPTANAMAFDLFSKGCNGANSPVCNDAASGKSKDNPIGGPNGILQTAANIIAVVTGIAAVILIIASGLTFATSSGNAEKAAAARRRIINAVIGLAIVALAWAITTFAISHFIHA